MREETKRQAQELSAGAARLSGTIIAIVAAWSGVLAVKNMLSQEPFGGELLGAAFLGLMAAVLITARAEKPPESPGENQE